MSANSINFWLGLVASLFLVAGGVWGIVKGIHRLVVKSVRDNIKGDMDDFKKQLGALKTEVTPNGRDSLRLGDIAARTETKVDNLSTLLTRYMDKVDDLAARLDFHLGEHEGM